MAVALVSKQLNVLPREVSPTLATVLEPVIFNVASLLAHKIRARPLLDLVVAWLPLSALLKEELLSQAIAQAQATTSAAYPEFQLPDNMVSILALPFPLHLLHAYVAQE
jgi:hypothetical protein